MKRGSPSVKWSLVLLILTLVWRMLGAPITQEQFSNLQVPLWQARVLMPVRVERILLCWFDFIVPTETVTMDRENSMAAPMNEAVWVNVYQTEKKALTRMTLRGYVCGVIAEEMPATYHLEALKAQAVAARTRVLAQKIRGGCSEHPGADICTDSAHCQGYASLTECQEKWKESYPVYRDRILQAEAETASQWLSYHQQPIEVFYHAISGGKTEAAQTVFSQAYPYLISVESAGEEALRGFRRETTYTYEEIAQRAQKQTGISLTAEEVRRTLSIASYTESGRVKAIQIGNQIVSGTEARKMLDLRSTMFSITTSQEGVTFHQTGYGHGVGMSQAGANAMASAGADYQKILLHYYPGVKIEEKLLE